MFRTRLSNTVVLLAILSADPVASFGQDIWFAPRSGPQGADDYLALFANGAPWERAERQVKAFEVSIELQSGASDDDLRKIFGGLKVRHIALALDMLPLKGGAQNCGYHVEGYSAPLQTLSLATRVKTLGGDVAYFDMDEPLYYGHFYTGANACKSTVEELIQQIAEKVKQVREVFPNVRIGETEPFPGVTNEGLDTLANWLDEYRKMVGEPLAFVRIDMDWNSEWKLHAKQIAALLRKKRVALQVIYNGSGQDSSDEEWSAHALDHARAFEALVKPRAVAIQSWTSYPKHVLPESNPNSMTGLINQYRDMHDRR